MDITRRDAILKGLFGAGMVGLRSLATGIPISMLLRPLEARADDAYTCSTKDRAQYLILSASANGDPLNANVPGTFDDPDIIHSPDPQMAKTPMTLGGKAVYGAKPWASLPQSVLDRTAFFHHGTLTSSHNNHPKVLRAMGDTKRSEMVPSVFAKYLASCFGTVQNQPVSLGAGRNTSEVIYFDARALPSLSPSALKATLLSPAGILTDLQKLRDADLNRLNALFKTNGTNVQRAYLDRLANSQSEARSISQSLLDTLSAITNDSSDNQVTAAAILIKMNVTPVVTVHIPFGGDNHSDNNLANETKDTVAACVTIANLMQKLTDLSLADKVTFGTLNVFGRTLSTKGTTGRDHLGNHHATVLIGKNVKAGVIGAVTKNTNGSDYKALGIDSASGVGMASGDITFDDSLAAVSKTMGAILGVPDDVLNDNITAGKVIKAAVA